MSSEKKIEASNPTEAIDPIEAIKAKILNAGYDVPHIKDDKAWDIILEDKLITKPEFVKIRKAILSVTSGPHEADSANEAIIVAKKRKSIEEANRAKETCPTFFDESILVAHQLETLIIENTSLLKQIVVLNETKAHFEKERSTVFRDACALYKRGIVELQLSIFMNEHNNDFNTFTCDGVEYEKKFAQAMHHWCKCSKHKIQIVNCYKEDRINLQLYADKRDVEASLWYLYDTLSGSLHFNAGEEYPIRVVPFPNQSDTLALLTFLDHYRIPTYITSTHPLPFVDSSK